MWSELRDKKMGVAHVNFPFFRGMFSSLSSQYEYLLCECLQLYFKYKHQTRPHTYNSNVTVSFACQFSTCISIVSNSLSRLYLHMSVNLISKYSLCLLLKSIWVGRGAGGGGKEGGIGGWVSRKGGAATYAK